MLRVSSLRESCLTQAKPHYFRNFYSGGHSVFFRCITVLCCSRVVFLLPLPRLAQPARQNHWWLWLYGANAFQAYRGAWCLGGFNHFWSLAVEEHFYLVWPR